MLSPAVERVGPYEIRGELGRGAMGVVYRAYRPDLDREFALKVCTAVEPTLRARFLREGRATAALAGHPHVVAVHDVGEWAGPLPALYLAMDLVEGGTLDALVARGDVSMADLARIGAQVARALAHAHRAGVLHRDVKPANILIDAQGAARLADFGLARSTAVDAASARLTQTGELLGTPAFLAPEQVRGEALDGRADVHALGATLYLACAGEPPFGGASLAAVLGQVLHDAPVPLRRRDASVPAGLEAVILRCLAKAPAARYPTADALAEDLERVARGEAPAHAGGASRHRRAVPAAVVVLGAIAVAGAWGTGRDRAATPPTAPPAPAPDPATRARLAESWRALVVGTRDAMRTLEDHWHGASVAPEAVDRAVAAVDRAASEVARLTPEARAPAAWRAYARMLARLGDEVDAATAGPGDPYPLLVRAHAAIARFAHAVEVAPPNLEKDLSAIAPYRESTESARARVAAGATLEAALAHPAWGALPADDALPGFVDAAAALARGDPAAARAGFARVLDDPFLGHAAADLLGVACYQARAFAESAAAFERAGARGWPRAWFHAAVAHLAHGNEQLGVDEDPLPGYGRALAAFDRALQARPADPEILLWRAHAYAARGEAKRWRLQPATADFAAAETDLAGLLRAQPGDVAVLAALANTYRRWADFEQAEGRDATRQFQQSVASYDAAIREAGERPPLCYARAVARTAWVRARIARVQPTDLRDLEASLADLDVALRAAPASAKYLRTRAMTRALRGGVEALLGRDARATLRAAWRDACAVCDAEPRDADARQDAAVAAVTLADALVAAGDDAREAAESGVTLATEGLALKPGFAPFFQVRSTAHSLLAQARARAGADWRGAVATAIADASEGLTVSPDDASLLYARAMAHKTAETLGGDGPAAQTACAADLRAAIARRPHFPQFHLELARCLARGGDLAGARAAIEAGLAAIPGHPVLARALAEMRR